MLIAKIFIAVLVAPVVGKEACGDTLDDATILLQAHTELAPGRSRSKPDAVVEELTANADILEHIQWLGTDCTTKGLAEFVAMTMFVFIGCGSAMAVANPGGESRSWLLQVSLTFGLAITALAYTIGHISGGQMNCAVTLGLVVAGHLSVYQAGVNLICQLLGAVCGSMITMAIFSDKQDKTGGLGTNELADGFTYSQALIAEVMGTFLLVWVVLETAVNPDTAGYRSMAPMAIGIAVFLAHSVLIPIDGCSINPTRSFGPMLVRRCFRNSENKKYISDHWIFWVGPLTGGVLAALIYKFLH